MSVQETIGGVEYTLDKMSKYIHAQVMAVLADAKEDVWQGVTRAAYRYLPYLLTGAPNIPARTPCTLDGIRCERIPPEWVAENIDGLAAGQLLQAALEAAAVTPEERKN